MFIGNILLNDCSKIVHLSEENNPAVVGSVMVCDLLRSVVSLFGLLYGQKWFEIVSNYSH